MAKMLSSTLLVLSLFCPLALASFALLPDTGTQLEQCSTVNLTWTEEPPIQLWVAPNREVSPGDPTLATLGPINDTHLVWTVNLAVGQNISFTYIRTAEPLTLLDSDLEYSIVRGTSQSCLNAPPVASSSTSSTSNATGSTTLASPTDSGQSPASATSPSGSPPSGSSTSTSSASASSSTDSSSNQNSGMSLRDSANMYILAIAGVIFAMGSSESCLFC